LISPYSPVLLVVTASLAIGMIMVVLFRYTSNQEAIAKAKDRLKAHLLALRLFQDQIPVVLRSYGRILGAIADYLRLSLKSLVIAAVPLTILAAQLECYLGFRGLEAGQTFLVKARVADPAALNGVSLELPEGLRATAPCVHAVDEMEIVCRVVAEKGGRYEVQLQTPDRKFSKQVVVAPGLERLSRVRRSGNVWDIFASAEASLPKNGVIQSIEVQYPERSIRFAGFEWHWIWLFLALSMAAGFVFKAALGIEI
jgi:hypothetical protein